jgi:hypothetical protein
LSIIDEAAETATEFDADAPHVSWLKQRNGSHSTFDGVPIEVWDFAYADDAAVLSAWACHFRNHYCLDNQIDLLKAPATTRSQYLIDYKFPTQTGGLGPATRAGDFGEILVADFLQWIRGCWVPRVRWSSKIIRNESPKGSDVVGFLLDDPSEPNKDDQLFIYEVKTKFSKSKENRLQTAINDSAKDYLRIGESLNFIKQKMLDKHDLDGVAKVERFQNPTDHPYIEKYGAAEIVSKEFECLKTSGSADCQSVPVKVGREEVAPHPHRANLELIVISGSELMKLTHKLYEASADEA